MKILITSVIIIVLSVGYVHAQTNPFLNAEISGPDTFDHYTTACYELPYISGASYSWFSSNGLRISCGDGSIWHAGFISPYAGGGWVWETVNGYKILVWKSDVPMVTGPLPDWSCTIRCEVTYNGQTYWFSKKAHVQGF